MTSGLANMTDLKQRYLKDAVDTASPAMRLTMLYDRLLLDLHRADQGFDAADLKAVNDNLIHAQEIIIVLRSTLREGRWEGATRLCALYDYLHNELVMANLGKDRQRAADVRAHVVQLAQAWHAAADNVLMSSAEVAGGVA